MLHIFVLSAEHNKVLRNMNNITSTLKLAPGATDKLREKYKQNEWIDIIANPSEDQLVAIAVERIKQDPKQHDLFIAMLNDITGMDLIVKNIKW